MPRFTHALLAEHAEGLVALSGCRHGELARRLRAGDREGARAVAERYAALFGAWRRRRARSGVLPASSSTTCCPTTTGSSRRPRAWPTELGLPRVVTNDAHYALPEDRELQDVLVAIRHGRSLEGAAPPAPAERGVVPQGRRGAAGAAAGRAVGRGRRPGLARAWREGIATRRSSPRAARSSSTFERYRFPGFPVPKGETPFSHLVASCAGRARGGATTR